MQKISPLLIALLLLTIITGCAFKRVTRSKNITYLPVDTVRHIEAQKLNVFAPRHHAALKNVLVFVYGGNWNSGHKDLYNFFGNRWARKDVVTVIMDYPKSPAVNYDVMATDVATAVKWVKDNIARYGGNPDKIFVSGHSAGGHLATLVTVRNDYFEKQGILNPIKGNILIDAAGINMYAYLQHEHFPDSNTYIQTFTNDTANWKLASPLYHLHAGMAPMLIYVGGKTYPSIQLGNLQLLEALKKLGYHPEYHLLKGKKHKPMITQFLNPYNPRYKEILQFMRNNK